MNTKKRILRGVRGPRAVKSASPLRVVIEHAMRTAELQWWELCEALGCSRQKMFNVLSGATKLSNQDRDAMAVVLHVEAPRLQRAANTTAKHWARGRK